MENKRLTNKLNSWFWAILTALPIIVLFILFIFALPQYAKNFDWNNNEWTDFINYSINNIDTYEFTFSIFHACSIPYIYNTFFRLFNHIFNIGTYNSFVLAYLFGWFLSVQIYHLIYDVLKFIIEWCHNLIERGVN